MVFDSREKNSSVYPLRIPVSLESISLHYEVSSYLHTLVQKVKYLFSLYFVEKPCDCLFCLLTAVFFT